MRGKSRPALAGQAARSAGGGGGAVSRRGIIVMVACNNAAVPLTGSTAVSARPRSRRRAGLCRPALLRRRAPGAPPALASRSSSIRPTTCRSTRASPHAPGDGDIIPARGVNYFATVKHDFLWPFRPTADYTKNADITYINLEVAAVRGLPGEPGRELHVLRRRAFRQWAELHGRQGGQPRQQPPLELRRAGDHRNRPAAAVSTAS